MGLSSDDTFGTLSAESLRRLVGDLSRRLQSLEDQVTHLGDQLASAEAARAALQVENQELRDEIARLKNLPPRPPFKPSGMDKVTEREVRKSGGPRRRRGPKRDKDRVTREEVLTAAAPSGSRFKGYRTILVRDLAISAELIRYRRERWLTPEGKRVIAPLPEGLLGGFGANLRRFCLALHAQGQVTTERLTAILNGIGMEISKRQVVRILTSGLDDFVAEDQAILRAGLATAPYISVDDTGARHARRDEVTTQIGGSRFSVFRTGRSKSRLNFLSLLRAGQEDYIINDAALDYMRQRKVAPDIIGKLAAHPETSFASQMAWYDHLIRLRLDVFDRTLVREVTEAALWGAVRPVDRIPAYRLSASSQLSRLGKAGSWWAPRLTPIAAQLREEEAAGSSPLVVDCRSGSYRSMMAMRSGDGVRVLEVAPVQESGGVRKVISHDAKRYRGLVTRVLLAAEAAPATAEELVDVVGEGRHLAQEGGRVLGDE